MCRLRQPKFPTIQMGQFEQREENVNKSIGPTHDKLGVGKLF